ncbi:MAG: hypothetical protein K2Y18_06095 [Alphaproteobacteria bacterium]|jgi:hypothetical protein|nr:hypothetical protein [Alphaproteobacteria bacterium]
MKLKTLSSVSSIVLFGLLSIKGYSKEATTTSDHSSIKPVSITKPVNTPLPGITPFESSKKPEGDANKTDNKQEAAIPVPLKPEWIPDDRKAGTITIKPLSVYFGAMTVGLSQKRQKINGIKLEAYRSPFGYMLNTTDRAGIGYNFELGYMITKSFEAFTILGITHETGMRKINVMFPPFQGTFARSGNSLSIDFKPRNTFEVSLGGRYYWNTQKPWFPFVGLMGTLAFQEKVESTIYYKLSNQFDTRSYVGPLVLQKRKTLFGGALQVGADYQFTQHIALTCALGVKYLSRPSVTLSSITSPTPPPAGFNRIVNMSFRDNQSQWSFPVLAALKITF